MRIGIACALVALAVGCAESRDRVGVIRLDDAGTPCGAERADGAIGPLPQWLVDYGRASRDLPPGDAGPGSGCVN